MPIPEEFREEAEAQIGRSGGQTRASAYRDQRRRAASDSKPGSEQARNGLHRHARAYRASRRGDL